MEDMPGKYKSEALMVIHQDAQDLFKIGAISAERLKEFDDMCLACLRTIENEQFLLYS